MNIKGVAYLIQKYILVAKEVNRLYKHIIISKQRREPANPIKYYFEYGKAPFTYHYVVPLEVLGIAAPKDRKEDELPLQWKTYNYIKSVEMQVSLCFVYFSTVVLLKSGGRSNITIWCVVSNVANRN